MSIGERIKKLLEYKGVTPYIVSMHTGVSQATMSRIIKNVYLSEDRQKFILRDY